MKFKSALVTQVSGSIGGMTGSHNKGGMYFRARAIPTDPQSPLQVAVRNGFGLFSQRWSSVLTQAQRDAWDLYASQVLLTDKLGDPLQITGQMMYVRTNTVRTQAGVSTVNDGPVIFELPTPGNFAINELDATAGTLDIGFAAGPQWTDITGGYAHVYLGRPLAPSRNFFKGPYRFVGNIVGDTTTPPTSPAQFSTLPFTYTAGDKVNVFVRVSTPDGRLSRRVNLASIAAI